VPKVIEALLVAGRVDDQASRNRKELGREVSAVLD